MIPIVIVIEQVIFHSELQLLSIILGLHDNENSPIMIVRLSITIITNLSDVLCTLVV